MAAEAAKVAASASAESPAQRLSPSSSVARGALALLGAQPVTWAATLATTVLLPRLLGADEMGRYGAVSATALLAGLVAALGVPDYLRRHLAQHPARLAEEAPAALALVVGASLLVAVVVGVLLISLRVAYADVLLLAVGLLWMCASVAQSTVLALLNGLERHAAMAWLNAAGVVLATALGLGAVAAGGGAVGFLAAMLVAAWLVVAAAWRVVGAGGRWRSALDLVRLRQVARGGLPFLGWNIALGLRGQIDVVLAATMLRPEVAGWLTAAQRVVAIPIFIPTLVATPLLPALSRCTDDRPSFDATLRRSLVLVLAMTLPVAALTAALAPALPRFLGWGEAFANASPLMVLLAAQQPIIAANMVLGTALFALRDERRWLIVAAVASIFKLSMNLWAIPTSDHLFGNGAIGAALFEVLTELAMLAGALVLLPRGVLNINVARQCAATLAAAGLLLATAALALRAAPLPIAAVAGGLVYAAACFALGVVRPADVAAASSLLGNRVRRHAGWPG